MRRPDYRDRRGETTPTPFSFPYINRLFTPTLGVKRLVNGYFKVMNKKELEKVMDSVISATFIRLSNVYKYHKENTTYFPQTPTNEGSHLVFPMYGEHRDNATRISEQELRFAFVESFNEYCKTNHLNLFYSVETPTRMKTYSGFSTKNPRNDDYENGDSANFDLVIYDERLNRICLIEFKANNSNIIDHQKDFLKLNNINEGQENVLRYFIELIKTYNDNTINSLRNKLKENKDLKAIFRCYALEGKSKGGKTETEGEKISDKIILQ